MADRFAGYDVLAGRDTPSWNPATRKAIDRRLALQVPDGVLAPAQLATLHKVLHRLCPDPPGRPATTTLAMVVHKIADDTGDGYRHHSLPRTRECWTRGLDALEAEARARYGVAFAALTGENADIVLRLVSQGDVRAREWRDLPPKLFWSWRLLPDCIAAHWAQPSLWSAMGFGGPAAPRGYVRTGIDRRDPWEAIEAGEPLKGLPRHRG
ncbi:MAG: gluconate 2-dehydrogenase subunit 3 family protein [Porphyrobacter sp.]|nr:gluconate 2-dehydrogenase subunit 3 family protein [Porphyrobacter sp.]